MLRRDIMSDTNNDESRICTLFPGCFKTTDPSHTN